jgi:hypothetical protein
VCSPDRIINRNGIDDGMKVNFSSASTAETKPKMFHRAAITFHNANVKDHVSSLVCGPLKNSTQILGLPTNKKLPGGSGESLR